MTYNMYICGIGGQGIIKTSIVIGETALKENMNVVMSEIHGMSQRGGVVSTELKIGEDKSPIIQNGCSDLLLAFEPVEAIRALEKTSKDTSVIVNTSPVLPSTINQQDVNYPNIDDILSELDSKVAEVYSFDANKIANSILNATRDKKALLNESDIKIIIEDKSHGLELWLL